MSDLEREESTPETRAEVRVRPKQRKKKKPQRAPRFHVILWNDEEHTYQYVVDMLRSLFGYPPEKGYRLAQEVDRRGRAIIFTSSLEKAEVKRDQILSYGPDPLLSESTGPLIATLEKDQD